MAWQITLDEYGLVMSEERFYSLGGVPTREIIKMLGEEQGVKVDPLAAARRKEEAYIPLMEKLQPVEEVLAIVREVHGKAPMAVATGGTRVGAPRILKRLGILELFDAIVTSEDVTEQKPAPDIFLEAARRLGVDPKNCVAYEDTDFGMQAIRAAGMEAVDVRLLRDRNSA